MITAEALKENMRRKMAVVKKLAVHFTVRYLSERVCVSEE